MYGGVTDPMARRLTLRWVLFAVVLAVSLASGIQPAAGTSWTVSLKTGSGGEAASIAASPPTGVTATCVSSTGYTIKISWTAPNTHVTSYTVYQATSTTTTPGTYASVKTGVTTTSWTTGTLTTGENYWYEVVSLFGTIWTSAKSSATGETTISSTNPECKQP
jgi:hypothetical protein